MTLTLGWPLQRPIELNIVHTDNAASTVGELRLRERRARFVRIWQQLQRVCWPSNFNPTSDNAHRPPPTVSMALMSIVQLAMHYWAHSLVCILTMAFVWAGYEWNHSSPLRHSPDTISPMYPDRPIRPLPKRRLRSRLSPEQADSMIYPPAPPTSTPLFSFPYGQVDKTPVVSSRQQRVDDDQICTCGADHSELESEDDEDDRAALMQHSPSLLQYTRNMLGAKAAGAMPSGFSKPPPPDSTASSADGYESFENTNNKKKRKIPNSGSLGGHHTNLSAEMANMGISSHTGDGSLLDESGSGVGQYYGTGSSAVSTTGSGTGISGAGRGRYGRSGRASMERRPLGASTNGLNAYANGGSVKARRDWNGTAGPGSKGMLISCSRLVEPANSALQDIILTRASSPRPSLTQRNKVP